MVEQAEFQEDLVHCRKGSSEMSLFIITPVNSVHCRIGSSEKGHSIDQPWERRPVHCRIGSSEMFHDSGPICRIDAAVHCRIGSSERG